MNAGVTTLIVGLSISAEDYQRLYQGTALDVVARAQDGRKVRFPAKILRPFILHDGIQGFFRIYFDHHNRFQRIERVR